MTIETEVQNLTSHAEQIANDEARTFGAEWMPGDASAQGDVNIVCIHALPPSAKPRKNRQMADGDTMGSRHILDRGNCYDADAGELAAAVEYATGVKIAPRYMGPVFEGPAELTHPEHGDQQWSAPCVNAVVIQRVWDAEQAQERRARD